MQSNQWKAYLGHFPSYILAFLKWALVAVVTGLLCGALGVVFHASVEWATEFRQAHDGILWLLPLAGLLIVFLYRAARLSEHMGTNRVIEAVHSGKSVPFRLAAIIFIGTVLTHLFGGSSGREGAALQIGGSTGYFIGRHCRLNERDARIAVLAGMSALFSALFGTPVTAAVFSLEVISVGIFQFSAFFPCLIASSTAYWLSLQLGVEPVRFALAAVPAMTPLPMMQMLVLGAACGALSMLFCIALHQGEKRLQQLLPGSYVRIFSSGLALVLLTFLLGTRDYNGAGMDVVARAIAGEARPEAFALKILFTALTISAGFKGGEIVPTFFVGATFGCVLGPLMGLDPSFAAAVGLIALFCGMVNCPIASVLLSVELFGAQGIPLFALACSASFLLSGKYSLYSSQKIMYSKLTAQFIDAKANLP